MKDRGACGLGVFVAHDRVRATEIDGPVDELAYAAPRSYSLIVDLDAVLLAIDVEHLRVKGKGKSGSRPDHFLIRSEPHAPNTASRAKTTTIRSNHFISTSVDWFYSVGPMTGLP